MLDRNQSERTTEPSFAALQQPNSIHQQPIVIHDAKSQIKHKSTTASGLASTTHVEEECVKCLEVVQKKMAWARLALESEHDPNMANLYLKVITNCVEAISALRKFSP